jgi:CrcB protein
MRIFLVGAAAFVAALLRWAIQNLFQQFNIRFPLGTFIVNITGCLLLGWFVASAGKYNASESTRAAIAVGFIGTYTTFSTYIYDSNAMLNYGMAGLSKACLNLFGSIVVGIIAMRIGIWLAQFT